jgi:hypothetical protein
MKTTHIHHLKAIFILFSFFTVLLLIYLPVFSGNYAHHDDYGFWDWDRQEVNSFTEYFNIRCKEFIYAGRFLTAGLHLVYYTFIHSLRDLHILRFISLLNISLCAGIFYFWTKDYLKHPLDAFLFTIIIFILPPFQVIIWYAWMSSISQALLFACLGCVCAKQSIAPAISPRRKLKYTLSAILLLFCSLMTYQTAAMFYWVMVALYMITQPRGSLKQDYKRLLYLVNIGLGSIASPFFQRQCPQVLRLINY